MLKSSKILLKRLLIWFIINTTLGIIIFSFLSMDSSSPRFSLFWSTMITTHIISSLTVITGYSLGYYFHKKSSIIALILTMFGTLCGATIGSIISFKLTRYLFTYTKAESTIDHFKQMLIPILIISASITIITHTIERLTVRKKELEKDLKDIEETSLTKQLDIYIKEDDAYHAIKHDDLIYLSSHGKKTTFHTIEKDYATSQLLKDIEKKLPADNFIRIHKQFIVNIKYLSKIRYYEGGRYMAYLKDEDESALPVGRKIAPFLKEKIGI